MEDEIVTKLLDKLVSERDPKNLLMLLAAAFLAFVAWVFREKLLVKWKRRPKFFRWLTDAYLGGVVTSMFVSGVGAAVTAIVMQKITLFGALNLFVMSALASGLASWKKALRKDREDKELAMADALIPDAPKGPTAPPAALLLLCALPIMGACASPITTAARLVQSAAEFGGVARDTLQDVYDRKLNEATKRAAASGDTAKAIAEANVLDGHMKTAKGALRSYSAALIVAKGSIVVAQSGRNVDLGVVVRELLAAYDALAKALAAFDIKLPKLSEFRLGGE